ncbi:hypothetical protein VaNZ11_015096 [Volvox africanus]|uniref:Protein kinase domain-containing protein n=1 Tax=Volvox africanus TaxID=51714 RepID=A0ABQ5SL62_9CHLO|nr:hypothetical protein VaNZ11_015096 [Volvox africanus]
MRGGIFQGAVKYLICTMLCCVSVFLKFSIGHIITTTTSSDSSPWFTHARPRVRQPAMIDAAGAAIRLRGRDLLSREDGIALVSNAQQFIHALADQAVRRLVVTAANVDLSSAVWNSSGVSLPVLLNRSITIEGDPSFAEWPVLKLNRVKGVARLAGGCNLTFHNLFIMYFREQPTRTSGFDFLLATEPGEPSFLFVNHTAMFEELCFPLDFRLNDVLSLPRPSQLPGNQSAIGSLPQDGCVNDTSVHPLRRCWGALGYLVDVATYGADINPATQSTKLNNQIVWATNAYGICEHEVDEYCLTVEHKEPLVCFLETKKKYESVEALKSPSNAEDEEGSGGAGLTRRSRVAVISATTIGGTLVVIVIVVYLAAAAVAWRDHGVKPPYEHSSFSGGHRIDSRPEQLEAARRLNSDLKSAEAPSAAGESDMDQDDSSRDNKISMCIPAPDMDKYTRSGHLFEEAPVTLLTPPRAEVLLDVQMVAQQQERQKLGNDSGYTHTDTRTVELLPKPLGKGSFGRVVEGLYDGRQVAVKLITSHALWDPSWWGRQQENAQHHQQEEQHQASSLTNAFVQSFAQEVQVLSRCQHPNIVQLVAACVTPPRLCLVMELMETSLDKVLYGKARSDTGKIPLDKVLRIGIAISNALTYLHPTIVHRDLKPANVLINDAASDTPVIKLTDFGLSRLRMTVRSTKHPDAGTPPYMAPECFDLLSGYISHQSDIYSLGVMLWEMLAGERPWDGMGGVVIAFLVTYRELRLPLDRFAPSRCPPKLARLLTACWDADPARRPAAAEVVKELTLIAVYGRVETTSSERANGTE